MHNVNAKDRYGHTPLIEAAKGGDLEAVKDMLHRGAEVDAQSDKGKTALHYAAANGHAGGVVPGTVDAQARRQALNRSGQGTLRGRQTALGVQ